jgi:hypothetical protein
MSLEDQGYIAERKPGEIVPYKALVPTPKGLFPYADAHPPTERPDFKGYRLVRCKAGCGDSPYELWILEEVGGPSDGDECCDYIFKPGHVPT